MIVTNLTLYMLQHPAQNEDCSITMLIQASKPQNLATNCRSPLSKSYTLSLIFTLTFNLRLKPDVLHTARSFLSAKGVGTSDVT